MSYNKNVSNKRKADRMKMKKSKIKLTKNQTIIYNAGDNFISDGNYIIKADLVELSDNYLQLAILQKQSFAIQCYDSGNNYALDVLKSIYCANIPDLKKFIPEILSDNDFMCLSNICIKYGKKDTANLFYKENSPDHIALVNDSFLNYFKNTGDKLQYYQENSPLGPICVASENQVLGTIMPLNFFERNKTPLSDLKVITEARGKQNTIK